MLNNIPVNGWPQLKDLEAVQPILNRLDKIEAWKRTVKEETFTGDEITIPNALALPARSLITEINAIQDLHGYDKPWVGGAGKNKCNPSAETVTVEVSTTNALKLGEVVLNDTTSIIASWYQNAAINGSADRNTIYLRLKNSPSTIYYATNVTTVPLNAGTHESPINNVPAGTYEVILWAQNCTTGYVASQFMVRLATETDPAFAPYSNICPISGRTAVVVTRSDGDEISEDFTIQLGTTVYGADINWDTGVMTILWASKAFSDIDNWNFNTSYHIAYCYVTGKANGYDTIMSDSYKVVNKPYAEMADGEISAVQGQDGMNVKDDRFDNLADFMTAMGSSQLVYELATPTTIQLTPEQLEMLKGYNRITLTDGYGTIELKALTGANWS